jgi:uncharacterized protein
LNQIDAAVWIDIDNTPHVPFFVPIIGRLRSRGHRVVVTARDAYGVRDLLALHHVDCEVVGRHFGKNPLLKVAGTLQRSAQLILRLRRSRLSLAVSHGSRAQMLAAKVLRVPSMVIADYEHVTHLMRADYTLVPDVMPRDVAARLSSNVITYPGIKEDVYACAFAPDPHFASSIDDLDTTRVIVTIRPPATEAHYHNADSDELFEAAIEKIAANPASQAVLLPRSKAQREDVERRYAHLITTRKILIPAKAVGGLDLIWLSDVVISGGGTMNREAAALGVPVFSIFRGRIGAVDRSLAAQGRLTLCESSADVHDIPFVRRTRRVKPGAAVSSPALDAIVLNVESLKAPSASIQPLPEQRA